MLFQPIILPTDPCAAGISYLPNPERRSDNCEYKQDQKCDDLISSTWYKTEEPMLDYCPGISCCGALYPIWLNGQNGSCLDPTTTATPSATTQSMNLDTQTPKMKQDRCRCVTTEISVAISIATMLFGAAMMFVVCKIIQHRNSTNQVTDDISLDENERKRGISNVPNGKKIHCVDQPPEYREKEGQVTRFTYKPDEE
ncbi:hypothetical protein FSP39_013969 [Pinctada imbricata]|uniref:Uncharacterized protein n=1 Tax=Pinctada imbricata TaxID=66713 RepID=A0AA89BZW5_PINIB|nr:hypothetical protein FSP39_013969 [Pinctada imbricata]